MIYFLRYMLLSSLSYQNLIYSASVMLIYSDPDTTTSPAPPHYILAHPPPPFTLTSTEALYLIKNELNTLSSKQSMR